VNDISRLAIIDRGEPVVRVLAAVGNLNRRGDLPPITSIVITEQSSERAWFAREADELITPPPSAQETDAFTPIPPDLVVQQVIAARADTAWIGHTPCLDRAELVAQLEAAGVSVVGPPAQTIRDLADPARLAALGRDAGLSPLPEHLTPADWRRIEIDVLADSAGTVWTLGLRDASVRRRICRWMVGMSNSASSTYAPPSTTVSRSTRLRADAMASPRPSAASETA